MSKLTRDETAEPVSRDQILRHARGQGNIIFPVQLTTSRIGNLTRLIHTLLYVMTIHTYIHTYSVYSPFFLSRDSNLFFCLSVLKTHYLLPGIYYTVYVPRRPLSPPLVDTCYILIAAPVLCCTLVLSQSIAAASVIHVPLHLFPFK